MRIYLAGPLFTQAEQAWNTRLAEALRDAGHEVFLPQDEITNLPALEAEPIFRLDVDGVRSAEVVVAVLDGTDPDSGTCFECGLAFALGIPIVAVRTDFRAGGDDLPGQRIGSINLMLSQSVSEAVVQPAPMTTFEAVAAAVVEAVAAASTRGATAPLTRVDPNDASS